MTTYVYKYEHPDYPWLYVGKSDVNLKGRIDNHKKENKFKPYLNDATIYYIELSNKAQSKFIETYLIDKHKPLLNVADKYEESSCFEMNMPEWKLYSDFIENNMLSKAIHKKEKIKTTYDNKKYKSSNDKYHQKRLLYKLHECRISYYIAENLMKNKNNFALDIEDCIDKNIYYDWLWIPSYNPNVNILKDLIHVKENVYKFIFKPDAYTSEFKEYLKCYIEQLECDIIKLSELNKLYENKPA